MLDRLNEARRKPRFLFAAIALFAVAPAFAACDFPEVKKEIDRILDQEKQLGAEFRKQMTEGADSLYVMEKMAAPAMREKLDECRFEAGEYLAKRGFPPAH